MNPVKESIRWLTEMGWTEKEAQHIAGALRGKTKEALWEAAPIWVRPVAVALTVAQGGHHG